MHTTIQQVPTLGIEQAGNDPSTQIGPFFNYRSARNKSDPIYDFIIESKPDIVALTETWFSATDDERNYKHIVEIRLLDSFANRRVLLSFCERVSTLLAIKHHSFTSFQHVIINSSPANNKVINFIVLFPTPVVSQRFLLSTRVCLSIAVVGGLNFNWAA